MGADYEGQEAGIAAVQALPTEGKEYLAHHLNNKFGMLLLELEKITRNKGEIQEAKIILSEVSVFLQSVGICSGGGRPTVEVNLPCHDGVMNQKAGGVK